MRQTLEVDSKQKHMLNKLNYLESSIQEEAEVHDLLLHQFISVVRNRDEFQLTSSTATSTQNGGKTVSKLEQHQNDVKEIPLVDTSIQNNPNRNNLSLIQKHGNGEFKGPVIPVVVFACNRVSVRNCLENLVNYRPNAEQFPIIVSQVSIFRFDICIYSILVVIISIPFYLSHRIVTMNQPEMSYYRLRRYF